MKSLRDIVHEALDNAYENNPEIATWTASDLATDLLAYTDIYYSMDEIIPYCEEWQIAFAGRP